MKFDAVIIGSGLGGLQCGYILSREGFNVCIIEKNKQLGGCLQTFTRNGYRFDTGMHYFGGMDEGQVLHRFFNYFQLTRKVKLQRLDESAYDIVQFGDKQYRFSMGYERFTDTMLQYFPDEKGAIDQYVTKLKEINQSADLYNIREMNSMNPSYFEYFSQGMDHFLNTIITRPELKNVLLGISPLYAGVANRTPLYLPMIIHSSFIEGAYRFVDGGSQISDLLAGAIKEHGGTIISNARVTRLVSSGNQLHAVEINGGEQIEGKNFIANIHPKRLLDMLESGQVKPAYRKRIFSMEETCGMFSLYLALHENTFEYINRNYYFYDNHDFWEGIPYNEHSWPQGYMVHFSPISHNPRYTNAVIVNTYMKWEEVKAWENTSVEKRGDDYKAFKKRKAEKLLSMLFRHFPELKKAIKSYYTSTPLTYRDYIGSFEGSVYGIQKDFNNPLKTLILPKTHIPNLFLTGQNMNIHGVLGVTIGSVLTCSELLGLKFLFNKIRHAQ
jgi:all-trans-retinol 13,14-reductase